MGAPKRQEKSTLSHGRNKTQILAGRPLELYRGVCQLWPSCHNLSETTTDCRNLSSRNVIFMVTAAKKVTSKNANGVLSTGKGSNGNDDVMTLSVIIKKVDAQWCDAKRAIFLCRSSITLICDIL